MPSGITDRQRAKQSLVGGECATHCITEAPVSADGDGDGYLLTQTQSVDLHEI